MRADRPEPAGSGRDPLGDLRERLARLPAGHPSSPDYRPSPEQGEDGGVAYGAPADLASDSHRAADSDRGEDGDPAEDSDRGEEADLGGGEPGRGDLGGTEGPGEGAADREDRAGGPHPRGAGRPGGADRSRHSQPTSRGPGPGRSPGGEPYRPWFSSGVGPDLWFSPDSGDRSG